MEKNLSRGSKSGGATQGQIEIPATVPTPSEAAFKWLEHQCIDHDTNVQELSRLIGKGRTSVYKAFAINNGEVSVQIRRDILSALTKLAGQRTEPVAA